MTLRGRSDLYDNLTDATDGIDMANVTNFSTRPKILIASNTSTDDGGDFDSGTLDLLEEIYEPVYVNASFRHDRYVIPATYKLVDQADETNSKEVMEEIDNVLRAYSRDSSHDYIYEMTYEITKDRGEILANVSFVLHKYYVDVTA